MEERDKTKKHSLSSFLVPTPLASTQSNNIKNTCKKYSSASSLNTSTNSMISAIATTNSTKHNSSLGDTKEKPFLQLHSSNGVERLNLINNQSVSVVSSSSSSVDNNQCAIIPKCVASTSGKNSSSSLLINNLNKNNTGDIDNIPKISVRQQKFITNNNSYLINNCVDSSSENNKMVAAQEMAFENFNGSGGGGGGGGDGTGTNDDTSEELKYGPGIVSRLRCRYLSLALRQTNTKQRPSLNNMRRATSLNNLLDNDDEECPTNGDGVGSDHRNLSHDETKLGWNNYNNVKHENNGYNDQHINENNRVQTPEEYVESFMKKNVEVRNEQRSRQIHRGNDSLKRARSVEALVRYDSKAWERDVKKESQALIIEEVANGNLKDLEPITIETKIINARERGDPRPKKIAPLLEEKERPPPDVVKEKLRIFESTANRKSRPNSNGRSEVAVKVATYINNISNEKPPITFPKPPQSPIKKPIAKPRQNSSPIIVPTSPVAPENNVKKLESSRPMSPLTIDLTYRSAKLDSPSANSPILSPLTKPVYRIPNSTCTPRPESPKTPDVIPRKNNIATSNTIIDSPITILSKKIKNLKIDSPKVILENNKNLNDDDKIYDNDDSDTDEHDSCSDDTKRISKSALENISKAGSTQSFTFNQNQESPLPALQPTLTSSPIKPYLPNGQATIQQQQQHQQLQAPPSQINKNQITYNNNESMDSNGRQIGVIRPLIAEPKLKFPKSDMNGGNTTVTSNNQHNSAISGINNSSVSVNNICSNINNSDDNNKSTSSVSIINNINNSISSNNSAMEKPTLTLREIEKNLINKEKSSSTISAQQSSPGGVDLLSSVKSINSSNTSTPLAGGSKVGSSTGTAATTASVGASNLEQPKWSLPKKKGLTPLQPVQNTTMVFKFTDRKDVPDYIENAITFMPRRSWPEVSHD